MVRKNRVKVEAFEGPGSSLASVNFWALSGGVSVASIADHICSSAVALTLSIGSTIDG